DRVRRVGPAAGLRTCAAGTRDAGRAGGRGVSPLARRAPGDRAGARGLEAARRERLSSPRAARGPRASAHGDEFLGARRVNRHGVVEVLLCRPHPSRQHNATQLTVRSDYLDVTYYE